jgi:hypothetical protein
MAIKFFEILWLPERIFGQEATIPVRILRILEKRSEKLQAFLA